MERALKNEKALCANSVALNSRGIFVFIGELPGTSSPDLSGHECIELEENTLLSQEHA